MTAGKCEVGIGLRRERRILRATGRWGDRGLDTRHPREGPEDLNRTRQRDTNCTERSTDKMSNL